MKGEVRKTTKIIDGGTVGDDYDMKLMFLINSKTSKTEWHILDKEGNHMMDKNAIIAHKVIWRIQTILLAFLSNVLQMMEPKDKENG